MSVSDVATVPVNDTAYGHITTVTEPNATELIASGAETEAIVRAYFEDIPIMIQVARCESTFRHHLADGSVLQGRVDNDDTGVMQINKRYHLDRAIQLGLDIEDIYDNMTYARILYDEQGTQPWSASAPCWSRTIAMR